MFLGDTSYSLVQALLLQDVWFSHNAQPRSQMARWPVSATTSANATTKQPYSKTHNTIVFTTVSPELTTQLFSRKPQHNNNFPETIVFWGSCFVADGQSDDIITSIDDHTACSTIR